MEWFRRVDLKLLAERTPQKKHRWISTRISKAKKAQSTFLRSRTLMKAKAAELKAVLSKCSDQHPCYSGACPMCVQVRQEQMAVAIANMEAPEGYQRFAATIIPAKEIIKPGELDTFDVGDFERRFKYALRNVDMAWAVFGIDYSLNSIASGEYEPHWAPHLQGLVAANDKETLRCELKKEFPGTAKVSRPVRVTLWDGRSKWLRYTHKSDFYRRDKYEGSRFDKDSGESVPCKKTRVARLRLSEILELYPHLHKVGLERRSIYLRCQLKRQNDGIVIVPMKQPLRKTE